MSPFARAPAIPEQIVEAFRAVAPAVEAFARENDLLIDRYRRGKSAWELRFARRAGGEAALTISYRERTGHVLDLTATWWVDDFESQSRRLKSEKIATYDRRDDPKALRDRLARGLACIEGWTLADLGEAHGPYVEWHTKHTSASFSEARNRLPLR